MFNQIYYSTKNRLWIRMIAFLTMVFGNGFFLLASRVGAPEWLMILGIVFSAFAMMGIFGISIYVTAVNFDGLLKDPKNYFEVLTPVPAWKKFIGAIIPASVYNVISIGLSIFFIVLLSFGLYEGTNVDVYGTPMNQMSASDWHNIIFGVLLFSALNMMILAAIMFASIVSRTILSRVPLRRLVSVVLAILAMCALSWLNIVLLPFGELQRFFVFFNITILGASIWQSAAIAALMFIQGLALTVTAAFIADRRS